MLLQKKPNAMLKKCFKNITSLVPHLNEYLRIHQISDTGNIRYTLEPYGFKTPTKTIKPTPKRQATIAELTKNPFQPLSDEGSTTSMTVSNQTMKPQRQQQRNIWR